MKRTISIAVGALLVLTACQGRRFEPAWTVNDFRVLGISAEPPEVRPGQSTQIRALTYASDGDVSYRWEWCPFVTFASDFYACPITQEELEQQIADNLPDDVPASLFDFPDFDLGTGETATLEYPFPQPLLVAFCEAIKQQAAEAAEQNEQLGAALPTVTCDETYEVSIRLVARNSAEPASDEMLENLVEQDPGEVIVASKKVSLWLGSENDQDQNPIVTSIDIRPKFAADLALLRDAGHAWVEQIDAVEDDWYSIPPDGFAEVLVGVQYELRALVADGTIQIYQRPAPQGSGERYRDPESEVLLYDWYTTAGALSPNDAFFVEGRTPLDTVSLSTFWIPETDTSQSFGGADGAGFIEACDDLDEDSTTGCEVRLWSVVRDSRRGINWLDRRLLATGIAVGAARDDDSSATGGIQ